MHPIRDSSIEITTRQASTHGNRKWLPRTVQRAGEFLCRRQAVVAEVIALAEMGYEAIGYDPSSELVSLGNELISGIRSDAVLLASHGSGQPADLGPPFDSVLFGWGGVSHIRGTAQPRCHIRATLRGAQARRLAHRLIPQP